MAAWLTNHPELAVWLVLTVIGACLPAESRAGAFIRRLTTDLAGKNAKPSLVPPEATQGPSTVIVAEPPCAACGLRVASPACVGHPVVAKTGGAQ
jgi:hypothetical protein